MFWEPGRFPEVSVFLFKVNYSHISFEALLSSCSHFVPHILFPGYLCPAGQPPSSFDHLLLISVSMISQAPNFGTSNRIEIFTFSIFICPSLFKIRLLYHQLSSFIVFIASLVLCCYERFSLNFSIWYICNKWQCKEAGMVAWYVKINFLKLYTFL